MFAEHPGVSSQLGDGGFAEGTRLASGVMAILRDGGFSPQGAVLCFATLYTFMTGQIDLDNMADTIASSPQKSTFDGVVQDTRVSSDDLFEFGFDVLIEGLKAKLLPQ